MKAIDPKSFIIGVLSTALLLTLTGAKKQSDNLGDILVNSITIADDGLGLGGWIAVTDTSGNEAIVIGLDEDGGKVQVNNHDGQLIAFLASDVLHLVGATEAESLAGLICELCAAVTVIPIPLAIGASSDAVQGMVVLFAVESCEQLFACIAFAWIKN